MRSALMAMCLTASAPSVAQPPAEFQGEATVVVHFVGDVDTICRQQGATAPEGWTIYGCHRSGEVWFPLPCNRAEWFADLACHEAGHALGWSHP